MSGYVTSDTEVSYTLMMNIKHIEYLYSSITAPRYSGDLTVLKLRITAFTATPLYASDHIYSYSAKAPLRVVRVPAYFHANV